MPLDENKEWTMSFTANIDDEALGQITGVPQEIHVDITPERARILREAEKCICGQREQDYGSPEDNFGTIAQMWTVYTGTLITALDVAMMMCMLKMARIKNGGGTGDSFVDLAGYAACGGEIWHDTSA